MERFFLLYDFWIVAALVIYFSAVVGHNLRQALWISSKESKAFIADYGFIFHSREEKVIKDCRDSRREVIIASIVVAGNAVYCFSKGWKAGLLMITGSLLTILLFYIFRKMMGNVGLINTAFEEMIQESRKNGNRN